MKCGKDRAQSMKAVKPIDTMWSASQLSVNIKYNYILENALWGKKRMFLCRIKATCLRQIYLYIWP
jgi:hypothetical protein